MKPAETLLCPPQGGNRRDETLRVIDQWTRSESMRRLVRAFDGNWGKNWSLDECLQFIESFSERWDFRRGAERLDTVAEIDGRVASMIREVASELGLTASVPPSSDHYDYILVLGGVALSCKLRTEYAAEIVRESGVKAGQIVLLGSSRRVSDTEREVAASFAPSALTEFDMMNAAAESAFRLRGGHADNVGAHENEHLISVVRRYVVTEDPLILSLSAPSSKPRRRATTEDTYAFLGNVVDIRPGHTALVCTSQIYFPFHFFGAMRMLALPYDIEIEVVGFPIDRASGAGALRDTHNLLQEIRSGIQEAGRLNRYLHSVA